MKVGLYFDLRNPPPWRQDPHRLYEFTLQQCERAEQLGCPSLWVTEHHLFEDGYLPQPLLFAGAIAARTTRARIGTAVILPGLYDPVHLAEQAALVDIISGGRLDLGVGAGYRRPEFDLFGADHSRRGRLMFERVDQLRAIWAEGRVTPAPIQDPLPIWIGTANAASARRTGRQGDGLLRIAPDLVEPYVDGIAEGGHDSSRARIAGPANVFLSDDPERDWPTVARHLEYQWSSYARYGAEGVQGAPPPVAIDPAEWRARGLTGGFTKGFLFGTPEDTAAALQASIGDIDVETIFVWASIAGMPEDLVIRNIELVYGRLAPLLA